MALLYDGQQDFSVVLQNIHNALIEKMKRNTAKKEALELQNILQQIKLEAKNFNNITDSIAGNMIKSQYYELIATAYKLQSQYHSKLFQPSTLFGRYDTREGAAKVPGADSILEEDLAALLAAGEFLGGNTEISLQSFLIGGQSSSTKAAIKYKGSELSNILDEVVSEKKIENLLEQLAQKEQRRASTQIGQATGKIDISGKAVSLNYSQPLSFPVERFMTLMKDATFSLKNYSAKAWSEESKIELSALGLHLGHSNLYKAVTGALSEVRLGHKQQTKIFYRGINIILDENHKNNNVTKTHFTHMRFIYELRGSGLLDDKGLVVPVKYLIYNDPSSDVIFVKDTASIILEALESAYRADNLLGEISLAASKVQS